MSRYQAPAALEANGRDRSGSVIVAALAGISGAAMGFVFAGHLLGFVAVLLAVGLCAGWLARGAP